MWSHQRYTKTSGDACEACAPGKFKDVQGLLLVCVHVLVRVRVSARVLVRVRARVRAVHFCVCLCMMNTERFFRCGIESRQPICMFESGICIIDEDCLHTHAHAHIGGDPCTDCPEGSSSEPGATKQTDCSCNAGYTGTNGGNCYASTAKKQCTNSIYFVCARAHVRRAMHGL